MEDIHVVTGASSGVGAALSQYLAGQSLNVLALARRLPQLESVQSGHEQHMQVLAVDLGTTEGRQAVVRHIEGRYRVRSLVHSAALATRGYLKELEYDTYRELMSINLEAPLFLTQALISSIAPAGRVLNLSSGSAYRSMEYHGLYSVSKAALLMLYQAWNADFPTGEIVFGSAMPGVVVGPMQDAARQGNNPGADTFRQYKADGRLIQPIRVAEFLGWLLLQTDDDAFRSQDWNIFDKSHHANWLDGPLTGQY